MPKIKTHKVTAKRIKITSRRKLRRLKQMRSHKRSTKSKRARREFDKYHPVATEDQKRIRRLLGLRQKKSRPKEETE
jgi:large subunit ribosomal protein L35